MEVERMEDVYNAARAALAGAEEIHYKLEKSGLSLLEMVQLAYDEIEDLKDKLDRAQAEQVRTAVEPNGYAASPLESSILTPNSNGRDRGLSEPPRRRPGRAGTTDGEELDVVDEPSLMSRSATGKRNPSLK
eukprot:2143922-Pyramimonas_sp.AAC.1